MEQTMRATLDSAVFSSRPMAAMGAESSGTADSSPVLLARGRGRGKPRFEVSCDHYFFVDSDCITLVFVTHDISREW